LLLEDFIAELGTGLKGKFFRENECVVAVEEDSGSLLTAVSYLESRTSLE
jgi:hypothetical protein